MVGYCRGRFSLALEPLEALVVYAVMAVAGGNPFLPLLGLMFRSVYGGPLRAFARWGLWMAAVFAAHDGRGVAQFEGDVARAVAMALVPLMCQALLAALRASEIIQRRLNSIVQNSTDVVTIVGADQRIRWQAESIRNVLGHAADDIVGTRLHDLVHPDDRPVARRLLRGRRRPARVRPQPDAAARPRRGRPPPLRRRRGQPPARPQRRGLRAQHA